MYTKFPHGHRLAGARPAVYPPFFAARRFGKVGKLENALGRRIRQFIGDPWLVGLYWLYRDPDIGIILVGWAIIIRDYNEPTSWSLYGPISTMKISGFERCSCEIVPYIAKWLATLPACTNRFFVHLCSPTKNWGKIMNLFGRPFVQDAGKTPSRSATSTWTTLNPVLSSRFWYFFVQ